MLIRIEVAPPGPLAVIGELPDAKLAILEGLNGIGKTLAIRLLQLCTGTLPYRPESPAWASLREGLGSFRVEITGLKDAHKITWVANSADWNARSEPEPTSDWFQVIAIDDRPVSLEAVQRLLTVHRMAGDEGIIETFASIAEADAGTVRRWMQRYAAEGNSPLSSLEGRAEQSLGLLLRDWPVDRYAEVTAAAQEAGNELASARNDGDRAQKRRELVTNALELLRRLREIRRLTPELSQQLAKIDEEIDAVQREREVIQQKLSALAAHLARTEPLQRELKNARRTLERNRAKLKEALSEATAKASGLGLAAELGPVKSAIKDLVQRLEGLHAEQTALDAAPAMRTLLDEVTAKLASAEERGLGGQVALEDSDTNLQLNVSQTRSGMLARRTYLEGQPPPPQARDVDQQLARVSQDLMLAQAALSALDKVSRLRQLVSHNEQRVDRALNHGVGPAASEEQTLEGQRRSQDDDLLRLAAKRAELAQQLGIFAEGATEEAIARQLAADLKQIGVTERELEDEAKEAEIAAISTQLRLTKAEEQSAATRREVMRANADIQRAALALAESAELGWVRRALGGPTAAPSSGRPEQLLAAIGKARGRVEMVVDRLGRHRVQLLAIDRALQAVSRGLRGQNPEAIEYVEQLQSWLSLKLSNWFNNPKVLQELLPQAEGGVEVDVAHRQVTWRESSGKRSRPLEAFSSGEQAFAYTRARLALLDETAGQSVNRLIILDEFGAFIAHDRLQGLLAYLKVRANDHMHDQVLIVLPLSRDYAAMAGSAVPSEATRLRHLAGQIQQRKYAVQVLVQ
jgi:hypothetical protein